MSHYWVPNDIRNPKRPSGYDHVAAAGGITGRSRGLPWNARIGWDGNHPKWRGPRRATALEAAQDYCDYMNGLPTPALPAYPTPVIDMGNTKAKAPKPEGVTIQRTKYVGPHDLYDVLVLSADGDLVCRKIGITARGRGRYLDICTTFGLSIKPYAAAKTFPSEGDARVAEAARVADVAKSPAWRRIAREAFAPVKIVV